MKNHKIAILQVSFGTSHSDTREKTIDVMNRELKDKFSDYSIYTAWTSSIIRRKLMERGEEIDDVPTAMKRMAKDGIKEVYVLSAHLLNGEEYEKLCTQAKEHENLFDKLFISKALLTATEDLQKVAKILSEEIEYEDDEAVVMVGHGTEHHSNAAYAALDYVAKSGGDKHVFIGAIEGFPNAEIVLNELNKAGYKKAVLSPMLLVAGEHAKNDMASDDEGSWRSVFENAGIKCKVLLKGLGEYSGIRNIYYSHLMDIIEG